jgi:hypothetical protein
MPQASLNFKVESHSENMKLTPHGGLVHFYDELCQTDFFRKASALLPARQDGWPASALLVWIFSSVLSGGEHICEVVALSSDEAICSLLNKVLLRHCNHRERRRLRMLFAVAASEQRPPAPTEASFRRFLQQFHDPTQTQAREESTHLAFIPSANEALRGLHALNAELLEPLWRHMSPTVATLDMDATLIRSHKEEALFTYQKFPGYQPLNVFVAESGLMLHSEFRDGNVNCFCEQERVFRQALGYLPKSVKKVYLRTDTQGYDWRLIHYCDSGEAPNVGVIEFAIGVKKSPEFRDAVAALAPTEWKPYYDVRAPGDEVKTLQEYALVPFAPTELVKGKANRSKSLFFVAIREKVLRQGTLPGMSEPPREWPFPTYESQGVVYKLYGLVSNRTELSPQELIRWHRGRCGASEHAHSEIKSGLAGGIMPSGRFGANAAWWHINVMAYNLQRMLALTLGPSWAKRRLKSLRRAVINVAVWVQARSRELVLRVPANKVEWFNEIGARLLALGAETG